MTREKKFDSVAKSSAIAVFEDELKLRSHVYAEYLAHGGKADCGEEFYLDALDMAIAALREQTVTDGHQLSAKDKMLESNRACTGCRWKGVRPQKCSCCRRNVYMKDNYEVDT